MNKLSIYNGCSALLFVSSCVLATYHWGGVIFFFLEIYKEVGAVYALV